MTSENEDLGTITRVDSAYEAKLTRVIEHSQDDVWAMLTNPSRIVDWLAPGSIELRIGGAARLNFVDSGIVIDSTVTQYDPPRLLEYSWSGPGEPLRPLRWELSSTGSSTQLTLTLQAPLDEDIARSCAGWEAHLMMLLAAIEGVPINFPFERFVETRKKYDDMLDLG